MAYGKKTGGRTKGIPNKAAVSLQEKLSRVGCDPILGMAIIALNNLPCGVCRGEGRTRYGLPESQHGECDDALCLENRAKDQPDKAFWCIWCSNTGERNISTRTCLSCYGTLFEACSPELRGKMDAELAQYVEAKRKAIEVSAPGGGPLQHGITVRFVRPNANLEKLTLPSSHAND